MAESRPNRKSDGAGRPSSLRQLCGIFALTVLVLGGCVFLLPYFLDSHSAVLPRAHGDPWFYLEKPQLPRTRIWERKVSRHIELLERTNPRIVFVGDSLTQDWETGGAAVWEEFYGDRRALNLGVGGDKTEHVLWRLKKMPLERIDPEVVVILIGINNLTDRDPPEEIARGVTAVVDQVEKSLPESRILLLSLFPAGRFPGEALRDKIRQTNTEISRRLAGRDITQLDIGRHFLNPDGTIPREVMPDGLHLTERGYRIWAESMDPTLSRLLNAPGLSETEPAGEETNAENPSARTVQMKAE